ncbi:MAG: fibronectin type III domain-containing protein [Bacteroidia bacterium]
MKKLLLLPLLLALSISNAQTVDPLEYATGSLNAQQQLLSYPLPRFQPGHTMNRNFIWFGIEYFSGQQQPGVNNQQMIANAKVNVTEFYKNWNYYFLVNSNIGSYSSPANYADTVNVLSGALTNIAKRNPTYKTSAISFWPQIGGNISKSTLSDNHYIRNSAGQYLGTNGSVGTSKIWSPVAPASSVIADGQKQKGYLQNLVAALGRPLTMLNENGEAIPLVSKNGTAITTDPAINADYVSSGLSINDYRGNKYAYQTKLYRDQFMSASPGTIFTHYALDGQTDYRPVWNQARTINTQINGKYYPTGDFYPRWPNNWKAWSSAWHGLGWFADCKYYELQNGDDLMSPFVCAGWNIDETVNVRPSQYLAMLKILSNWGSEFFYTGYFSLAAPYPDSKNWGWQTVMPVYAQAVTSRYESIFKNSTLLTGDVPRYFLTSTTLQPNNPKYLYYTGNQNQLVSVRKLNGAEKYVITAAQMVDANTINNAPMSSFGKFKLGNDSLNIEFRRQGSVYIYDATVPSAKVFYQLDSWHQYEHPERWSKDFQFEAEVFDNNNTVAKIKTEVPSGTAPGDYKSFTSYISYTSTPTAVEYNFTPRGSQSYYVWVRARSKNSTGGAISVNVAGQASKSLGCISSTAWTWYSLDACTGQAIAYTNLSNKEYSLSILASNSNIEIDKILLSSNSNLNLNPNQTPCGTTVANVNTSGPTNFCQGGSVTLTAAAGTSYSWSNGQTTQAITVSLSGTYTVNVNNGTGCASVSAPIQVTVNTAPSANITTSSNTICQGQSSNLTASPGSTFLWSNGATTQTIQVNNAGSYSVIVTGSSGCSTNSTPVNITIGTAANATVTTSGPTSFCQGGNVILSAATGYNYTWSNGSTSRQITVSSAGNYSVVVSANGVCSATSQTIPVTVNANPTASINANGNTTFCQGGSVNLTATGGSSYAWSNGQTGSGITVNSTGTYNAIATGSNGCTATSNNINITVAASPSASIAVNGPTVLNVGQTTNLVASGGGTYLWQPGGQTTSSITVNSAGSYTVTVTNASGCTSTSAVTNITMNNTTTPIVISTTGAPEFCSGGNIQLTATGGANYLWAPSGQTSATITVYQAGTYFVYARNSNGMVTGKDSITVKVLPNPMNPWISITYFPNTAFQLNAFEPSAVTYNWSTGSTSSSVTLTAAQLVSVTATNAFGCTSGPTSLQSQNVASTNCSRPNMLTAYNLSDTTAMLGWNPSITAEKFIIRYWQNGSGTVLTKEVGGNFSTCRINNLQPGTSYFWTIESVCTSGIIVSSISNFKTLGTPLYCGSVPQHLSTANISTSRATATWYNTTADSITIKYRQVGANSFQYRKYSGLSNPTSGLINNLIPNTTYEWQVRTLCNGYTSPYSQMEYFTTRDTCGSIGTVTVGQISSSTATVYWTNLSPMDTIRIRLVHITNGGVRNIVFNASTQNGTYQIRALLPNTTYYVEVKGKCGGTAGSWSAPATFTTTDISTRIIDGNHANLNAYPNPTSDMLYYSFSSNDDSDYQVKVCDMSGRELMQQVRFAHLGDNVSEIPVHTYAKGAYILVITKGTQRSNFRFTVK